MTTATEEIIETTTPVDRGDDYTPPTEEAPPVVDEPAATPEPVATAPVATDQAGIPKARFNEVNEERKNLKAMLEEAKRELAEARRPVAQPVVPEPVAFDEDAAEEEYTQALMDGDSKKATTIRKGINANLRAQAEAAAEGRYNLRQAQTAQQSAAVALAAASDQAIKDFPYLDTDDGTDALELIVAARDAKIARGIPPAEALRQAVATIAPKFAPADDEEPDAPTKDTRGAAALARGAADSGKQPPNVQAGVGNRATATRIDVKNMSDEEFSALPASEKKRLRGDA